MTSEASGNKLKVLALHGYRQNSSTFRQKTGSFRKLVSKWADFTFITAPHKVEFIGDTEDLDIIPSNVDNEYGWFFNRENNSFRGIRMGGPAIGFEDSVKLVEHTYLTNGPFDGLWGFSQGACFVALLCELQQKGLLKTNFNFAVMVAGFKSGSIPHMEFYSMPISLPSLHVYGEGDKVIPSEMSEALTQCFYEPIIVKHLGGHYVPASSEQKELYQTFFKNQYAKKNVLDDI